MNNNGDQYDSRWPDDRFLTRREAEILIGNAAQMQEDHFDAHTREHQMQAGAIDKALTAANVQQTQHNVAHDKAHGAHEEKHISEAKAVQTALAAVDRERRIHSEAHIKEHEGHIREHGLNNQAIDKAEQATDKRFTATNAFRETFEARLQEGATKDSVESLRKEFDRRIGVLEQTDVKAEGRGLGQTATLAWIVTATTVVGSIIVIVNLLASATP